MKLALRTKILGAFALIVLVSLGTVVGTGARLTRSRYDEYVNSRDRSRARALSLILGEWTAHASQTEKGERTPLPGIEPLLIRPPPADWYPERRDETITEARRGRMMNGMMDRMERMMSPAANPNHLDRIVVTSLSGEVLFDSAGYAQANLDPSAAGGVPIRLDNRIVGYLYLGQMIPGFDRRQDVNSFLQVAGYATWIVTAFVFLFALLLGVLLTKHITGPVKTLNSAAKAVEDGNLKLRVPDKRSDELGDLSRGFNSMAAALESADNQRRRLIADSAHELRTPVSLVRARIEMMEEGIYPMDKNELAALSAETGRLSTLVEELGMLANLETLDFVLAREQFLLANLLGGVFEAARPAMDLREIDFQLQLPPDDIVLYGDQDKLHQLLSNLLNNAQRHALSKIVLSADFGKLTSGAVAAGSRLKSLIQISVEDDGPGIPEAERERVFNRFFRLDESRSRSTGGSGLGLAICREIAIAHGGRIYADQSEALGGAAIRVALPAAREPSS